MPVYTFDSKEEKVLRFLASVPSKARDGFIADGALSRLGADTFAYQVAKALLLRPDASDAGIHCAMSMLQDMGKKEEAGEVFEAYLL